MAFGRYELSRIISWRQRIPSSSGSVQAAVAGQKTSFPKGYLLHHFVLPCVFVRDFEDAEPEILSEVFLTLGVQSSYEGVPKKMFHKYMPLRKISDISQASPILRIIISSLQ